VGGLLSSNPEGGGGEDPTHFRHGKGEGKERGGGEKGSCSCPRWFGGSKKVETTRFHCFRTRQGRKKKEEEGENARRVRGVAGVDAKENVAVPSTGRDVFHP